MALFWSLGAYFACLLLYSVPTRFFLSMSLMTSPHDSLSLPLKPSPDPITRLVNLPGTLPLKLATLNNCPNTLFLPTPLFRPTRTVPQPLLVPSWPADTVCPRPAARASNPGHSSGRLQAQREATPGLAVKPDSSEPVSQTSVCYLPDGSSGYVCLSDECLLSVKYNYAFMTILLHDRLLFVI